MAFSGRNRQDGDAAAAQHGVAREREVARSVSAPAVRRHALRRAAELEPHARHEQHTTTRSERVAKRTQDELDDHRPLADPVDSAPPLPEELDGNAFTLLQERTSLDDATLASVFGVDAITMEHWRRHGVPAAHAERLRRLREAVARVGSHGRERPIASALRHPLRGLGGSSLLDAVADDDRDLEEALRIALDVEYVTLGNT
jgi:hypothetical protein